jgi:hypothetical protein
VSGRDRRKATNDAVRVRATLNEILARPHVRRTVADYFTDEKGFASATFNTLQTLW